MAGLIGRFVIIAFDDTVFPLGNDGLCLLLFQSLTDPLYVKCLVGEQSGKVRLLDERGDADSVKMLTGDNDEADQIAERVC